MAATDVADQLEVIEQATKPVNITSKDTPSLTLQRTYRYLQELSVDWQM